MSQHEDRHRALSLEEVARRVGGRVEGDGELEVTGITAVDSAGPRQLAFLASSGYVVHAADSEAGAFLVTDALEDALPDEAPRVVVEDGYAAMRTLLEHFHPPTPWTPSVHPTAVLGDGVRLGEGIEIGPYAVLEEGVSVGKGSRIGAHCVVGRGSVVGEACRLRPHVVLYEETVLGDRVVVHSGARLGPEGFGYTVVDGEHAKIPQVGRCVIEDDVEIGANAAVDRGSLGDTRIGRGSKLDNLVHIAHNVTVGARSLLAALVGIAGSTRIGEGAFFGGQSGAVNGIEIGDGAKITVQSGVIGDVEAEEIYTGYPARPHKEAMKGYAGVARLPQLTRRVKALENDVARIVKG